jgi:hypothetical protein
MVSGDSTSSYANFWPGAADSIIISCTTVTTTINSYPSRHQCQPTEANGCTN